MSVPNIGPDHFDAGSPDAADSARRGNPPPALRDETATDDLTLASARASAVSHRFGGVSYALTRPDSTTAERGRPDEEDDSDARE
jgi:hypothetical protein